MQAILDYQADQIEWVLQTHRSPGRVTGGVVTPRWISYQITPAIGTRVAAINRLTEEIALRLGTSRVRISRRGGQVRIEVPREDAKAVRLDRLCQQLSDVPRQSAVLGLDDEGKPLLLRFPSPEVAHVLVAGTTGSGKTALVRSMILSLAMFNRLGEVQMVLIDPKGQGFGPLSGLPHLLRPVIRDVHQSVFVLAELVEEMVRRDQTGICEPRVIIFIDEVADLLEEGGNAVGRLLTRLTQRGRSAGLHIVACTQKPLAATIGSLTKSNFPVRLVGSVTSATDAQVAAGISGSGAEQLLGRGDFLLVAKGQIQRFQAAFADQQSIRSLVQSVRGSRQQGQHWLAAEAVPALAATGTDGPFFKKAPHQNTPPKRLESIFGLQLRLMK